MIKDLEQLLQRFLRICQVDANYISAVDPKTIAKYLVQFKSSRLSQFITELVKNCHEVHERCECKYCSIQNNILQLDDEKDHIKIVETKIIDERIIN